MTGRAALRSRVLAFGAALAGAALLGPAAPARADLASVQRAVVRVTAMDPGVRIGAGVLIARQDRTAYILTSRHVIDGAAVVEVEFDSDRGKLRRARVVAVEDAGPATEKRALALLVLEGDLPSRALAVRLSPSSSLRPTEPLHLIGFPQKAGNTWTISPAALSVREDVLVLSGAVDSGNSGGPVVAGGRVVGLVTQMNGPFAFARPAEDLDRFLARHGVPAPTLAAGVAFDEAARLWKIGVYEEVLPLVRRAAEGRDDRAACLLALALTGFDEDFVDSWELEEDFVAAWRQAQAAARSGNPAAIWIRQMTAGVLLGFLLEDGPSELAEEVVRSLGYEPWAALVAREAGSAEFRRELEKLRAEHPTFSSAEITAILRPEERVMERILTEIIDGAPALLLQHAPDAPVEPWSAPGMFLEEDLLPDDNDTNPIRRLFFEGLDPGRIASAVLVLHAHMSYQDAEAESLVPLARMVAAAATGTGLREAGRLACRMVAEHPEELAGAAGELLQGCRSAAEARDLESMELLGDLYAAGVAAAPNQRAAATWYRLAAEAGQAGAMVKLGNLHELGLEGGASSYYDADQWYRQALARDPQHVLEAVSLLLVGGPYKPRDQSAAIRLLVQHLDGFLPGIWFDELFRPPDPATDRPPQQGARPFIGVFTLESPRVELDRGGEIQVTAERTRDGPTQQVNYIIRLDRDYGPQFARLMFERGKALESGRPVSRHQAVLWYRRAAALGDAEASEALRRLGAAGPGG